MYAMSAHGSGVNTLTQAMPTDQLVPGSAPAPSPGPESCPGPGPDPGPDPDTGSASNPGPQDAPVEPVQHHSQYEDTDQVPKSRLISPHTAALVHYLMSGIREGGGTPRHLKTTLLLVAATCAPFYTRKRFLFDKFGLVPYAVLDNKQLYRLITSALTHSDQAHLLGNVCGLVNYGCKLEKHMGSLQFAAMTLSLTASTQGLQVRAAKSAIRKWQGKVSDAQTDRQRQASVQIRVGVRHYSFKLFGKLIFDTAVHVACFSIAMSARNKMLRREDKMVHEEYDLGVVQAAVQTRPIPSNI